MINGGSLSSKEQPPAAILWCQEVMGIMTARSKTLTWKTGNVIQ